MAEKPAETSLEPQPPSPPKVLSYSQAVKKTDPCEIPPELLQQLQDEAIPEFCDSDLVIAQMLQNQFDQEYQEQVRINEKKRNGLYKYKRFPGQLLEEPERETRQREEAEECDDFELNEREYASIPACGYKVTDGKIVTKHDQILSGRRNASKVMEFPPEFHTGDAGSFDMQLSNRVFNSLRAHSKTEQAKRNKMLDRKESQATAEMGMDEPTRLLLYKLVNNGMLAKVNGIIATGKESIVIHADSDPTYTEISLPKECAIKVFKTTLNEFKTRDKYIKDDYRFKQRFSKLNPRKVIHLWAEKELHNLMRIQKLGLKCPDVVCLKKHILVMSFIGNNHITAPQIKEVKLSSAEWESAYNQVVHFMDKLFKEGHLVHADLSEYNILWHDSQCWFIDVSQSVEPEHPNALQFLLRDCNNVSSFFRKKGVANVSTAEQLFESITRIQPQDLDMRERTHFRTPVNQVDDLKDENEETKVEQYPFEYAWEKSKRDADSLTLQHEGLRDDFEELWKMSKDEKAQLEDEKQENAE